MLHILLRLLVPRYCAQSAYRQISVINILTRHWHLLGQQTKHLRTLNYSNIKNVHGQFLKEEHFGTLSEQFSSQRGLTTSSLDLQSIQNVEENIEDIKGLQKMYRGRRNTPYWYFLQCKAKIKDNKLAEALELFEVKMLLEERLQPEEYNYTVLIGGCGRVGYTKKAFQLYSNMKKRGLKPTDATYTALFNACAESPWKDSGLQYAFKLRKELMDKNFQLNPITYRSLLKACIMCSSLQTSIEIFKEITQKCPITSPEVFNILLMGCIKDEKLGFIYALQVWRQMMHFGIKPDIKTYNLLLRATKDCGTGDVNETVHLFLHSNDLKLSNMDICKHQRNENTREPKSREDLKMSIFNEQTTQHRVPTSQQSTMLNVSSEGRPGQIQDLFQAISVPSSVSDNMPNLLDPQINIDSLLLVKNGNTPFDRFSLIGDMEGILQKMRLDHVVPTIKTFTLMAELIKPDMKLEATLLGHMNLHKIKPDLTFLNTLVLKRSEHITLESATEMLVVFTQLGIAPNIHTFSILAKAGHKKGHGLQLLQDMVVAGFHPNNHVYSALINAAIKRLDYVYLTDILWDMKNRNVAPNEIVIRQLEFAAQYPPTFDKLPTSQNLQYQKKNVFMEKIDGFRGYYKRWLEWMDAKETQHPWKNIRPIKKIILKHPTMDTTNNTHA